MLNFQLLSQSKFDCKQTGVICETHKKVLPVRMASTRILIMFQGFYIIFARWTVNVHVESCCNNVEDTTSFINDDLRVSHC